MQLKSLPVLLFGVAVLALQTGSVPAYAQVAPSLNPERALTQYLHEHWGIQDGLPQNSVSAVLQTRDGYLWIGTEEGLARYNGLTFDIWDTGNTTAFKKTHGIRTLFEDSMGILWIGTAGSGLLRYEAGALSAVPGIPNVTVSSLYEDQAGTLWVGTWEAGLFSITNGRVTAYNADTGDTDAWINALYVDGEGRIWMGTREGLHWMDGDRIVPFPDNHLLSDPFITALTHDTNHRLWIGTRGGLDVLHGDTLHTGQEKGVLAEGGVRSLFEDRTGSLWIGMDQGGIGRLHAGNWSAFTQQQGLLSNRILAIFEDREGSLWFGTERGGLNRFTEGKFTTITNREGLSDNMAFAVTEGIEGDIWIGTESGGLNRVRGDQITSFTQQDGLTSASVTSLFTADDSTLWIGTLGGGLNVLRHGRISSAALETGLEAKNVFSLFQRPGHGLWIGTDEGIAHLYQNTLTEYTVEEGLGSNFTTVVYEDSQGGVWIGSYDAGLSKLSQDAFTNYTVDDGLAGNLVLDVYEDGEGSLWVSSYGHGLSRIKQGRIVAVSSKDGLFSDTIYRILADDRGRLWMSSNKGIFTVDLEELNAFAEGKQAKIPSTAYGLNDGLRSPEMNGGFQPAGWKGRDGRLWFPGVEGVAVIDPERMRHNPLPPPVVIDRIATEVESFDIHNEIVLSPGHEKLDIHYQALSFLFPEKINFKYKLEGFNTAWQDAGTSRIATYTNLAPGPYTFHVLAQNNDGVWNETGASISFYQAPFFYQTAWFKLLSGLLLLLVAYSVFKLRLKQLQAKQKELEALVQVRTHDLRLEKEKTEIQAKKLADLDRFKTRFFANVSHEFRTPLTMIIGPLENALQGSYGTLEAKMHRQVEIMLRNAQRLLRLINQLLDLSKLEAGKMTLRTRKRDIRSFLENIMLSSTPLADKKEIELSFDCSRESIMLYFEPDQMEKVFFNLLSNALKFTPPKGHISLSINTIASSNDFPEGALQVRVRDTGKGIPADELPHIFDRFRQVDGSNTREHEGTGIGLALVHELVTLHRGTIDVSSAIGTGTEFIIRLPLGARHLKQSEIVEEANGPTQETGVEIFQFAPEPLATPYDAPADAKGAHSQPDETILGAKLVLVVDDNEDLREYISSILASSFNVETARDGREGLEKARSQQPDLIISDVMMPRMDGNEFCRTIKTNADTCHIPFILLTARATHELKLEGLEMGADDYLSKPFNARELFTRAKNLLTSRHQEKQFKQLSEQLEEKVAIQLQAMLDQRFKYEAELIEARDIAETASRFKSEILSNITHEFRTPISGIISSTEILKMDASEDILDFVDYIGQSANRLLETIESVITLSDLVSDTTTLSTAPVDLNGLVREVVGRYALPAEQKGLALEASIPEAETFYTIGDPAVLKDILDRILDNAFKYTTEGGVFVNLWASVDQVFISVEDTGIGMDESFVPRMFGAFVQESEGPNRMHQGCGIGMTIAMHQVERMGGAIAVESQKGEYTKFTLQFMLAEAVPNDGVQIVN